MVCSLRWLKFLFVGICLGLANAKDWHIRGRIVSGSSAERGQFPYQVSFRSEGIDKNFCGGTIIGQQYILTAAHCFIGDTDLSGYYAAVNITHETDAGQRLKLSNLVVHPEFRAYEPLSDIALIRTKEPIEFSHFVKPVDLPSKDIEAGMPVVMSGWGDIEAPKGRRTLDSVQLPTVLQFKEVITMTQDQCIAEFKPLQTSDVDKCARLTGLLNEKKFCTRNVAGSGSCYGDSGGPLVSNNKIVGIISSSMGCAQGYPTINTNVFSHVKWIYKQMAELDKSNTA